MLRDVFALLTGLSLGLVDRLRPRPVASVEDMIWFVRTRSAYVAQTSLYGYVKTRMGTRFRDYFEDEVFSGSVRTAAEKLFVSCAADLTIFAVALGGRDARLGAEEATALARRCFSAVLAEGLGEVDARRVPAEAMDAFADRARRTNWAAAAKGEAAFSESLGTLVRVAPIAVELKELDREIVTNSIRFRWRDIREQLRRRMRQEAVLESWRSARN